MAEASIVAHFSILKDPRIERHKKHNLIDILVLAICGVLSGAEGWEAIEEYGQTKLEWLRKFIPLENGIPAHDTIARVLSRISAKGLQECFSKAMSALIVENAFLVPGLRPVPFGGYWHCPSAPTNGASPDSSPDIW